jgi:glycosyltransferase involved in cell wall biosynthesis
MNTFHEPSASGKPNVLIIVAHEPERDPRLAWITRSASATCVVHQLGVSRVPDAPQSERGTKEEGYVWAIPRGGRFDDLGVLKELVSGAQQPASYLEVASLISLRLLDDRQLRRVLGCSDSPRLRHFKWNVCYILDIAYTLTRFANNLTGVDAIIATDLDTLLAGVLLKERFGVPLIYDAHEFWPAADVDQADFEESFWTSLERRLVGYCDYAQTVTPGLAAHMSRLYGIRFFSTPNAEPLSSRPQGLPGESRLENDSACRFLFQGGFAPARGIDILIKTWPRTHPDAILVLRGPDNEYRQDMIRLAKSTGLLGNRVVFAPSVSELELVVAAVGFDVGLIPYTPTGLNYANCCPNKLSQYMAAGLPILACRTSFVEQIVGDAAAGAVVDFSDTDSLVKEVNRFVCDIDYRLRSGRSSANYFSSNFHWEVLSQPFLAKLAMLARLSSLRIGQDFSISGPTPFFPDVAMPVPRKSLLDMLRGIWRLLPASVRLRLRPTVRRLVERFHLALR